MRINACFAALLSVCLYQGAAIAAAVAVPAHDGAVSWVRLAPDGRFAATAGEDGSVAVWSVPDGRLKLRPECGAGGRIPRAASAFSSGSAEFALGCPDGTVRVWPLSGDSQPYAFKHGGPLAAVAFSSGGKLIVSAGKNGIVKLWRQGANALKASLQGPRPAFVSLSDGVLASGGAGDKIVSWQCASGSCRVLSQTAGPENVLAAAPAGEKNLAFISGRELKLWDMSNGELLFRRAVGKLPVAIGYSKGLLYVLGAGGKVYRLDPAAEKAYLEGGLSCAAGEVSDFLAGAGICARGAEDGTLFISAPDDESLPHVGPSAVVPQSLSELSDRAISADDSVPVLKRAAARRLPVAAAKTYAAQTPPPAAAAERTARSPWSQFFDSITLGVVVTIATTAGFIYLLITMVLDFFEQKARERRPEKASELVSSVAEGKISSAPKPGIAKTPHSSPPLPDFAKDAESGLPDNGWRERKLVGGRYDVLRQIGKGGMAVVYEAEDVTLNKKFALKKLHEEFRLDEREKRRLFKEAKITARLKHPNIVDIYTVLDDGDIYLVLEYVEGRTLDRILRKYGKIPVRESVAISRHVLSALEYAHGHGVVHRDLKPSNIMVAKDGFVRVMDFGIAKISPGGIATVATRDASGTAAYMAPEQYEGIFDPRSDIYSFGITLYEMLTGVLPFAGPDFYRQKKARACNAPKAVNADLPQELSDLVFRCLEPEPQLRWESARRLGDELSHFAAWGGK